jgi:thiamine-monophosphate kinase
MPGEFAFIEKIRAEAARHAAPDESLVLGIGDDAAVWCTRAGYENLITVDLLAEEIDFKLDYAIPRWLGHKSLAVSLSDIAAMGASPRFSLLTLAIPGLLDEDFWQEFFTGYFSLAARHKVQLIGGDISATPNRLTIDSIVIGECRKGAAIKRHGASPGEAIYLTGALGASAAGLRLLLDGARPSSVETEIDDPVQRALRAHLRPEPRTIFGRTIGALTLARSMIDVSDGLTQDLAHLCRASGVSAIIDYADIPIAAEVALAEADVEKAFALAVSGGEDFELLLTGDPGREKELRRAAADCEVALTRIGEIVTPRESPLYLRRDGELHALMAHGYDHFAV